MNFYPKPHHFGHDLYQPYVVVRGTDNPTEQHGAYDNSPRLEIRSLKECSQRELHGLHRKYHWEGIGVYSWVFNAVAEKTGKYDNGTHCRDCTTRNG
jgi:hypothetical protein